MSKTIKRDYVDEVSSAWYWHTPIC